MIRTIGLALAAALLIPVCPSAQPRVDYSGDWVLNLGRSRLDQRVWGGLERGTVQITHRGGTFGFSRVFTVAGREDKAAWELVIDAAEKLVAEGPVTRRSRIAWEDGLLVLRERLVAPQGEATNTVHYRLLDDGRTLEARESFRGPRLQYDNVWILERPVAR